MARSIALQNLRYAAPDTLLTRFSATGSRQIQCLPPGSGGAKLVRSRSEMTETITIRRPDDWHVHFRDGAMLRAVLPFTARQFARAIVMPNLVPPVTDVAAARAYRERIVAVLPAGADFTPLMTCYLTDATDAAEVARGHAEGVFAAVKLYPAHATTHSAHGVTDLE